MDKRLTNKYKDLVESLVTEFAKLQKEKPQQAYQFSHMKWSLGGVEPLPAIKTDEDAFIVKTNELGEIAP